ncbi:DUF3192 domain-containing protein [Alteromonas sp. 5E99-2]|uniref:DUF3192 domain-containing protein n=1 Tax=Alteromonas sp. 5E99-2 TaxID=2817683 RepID=UPI001F622364|nr:DUF3192 domain-containing protein [Alteromonas sp. 5E99-2]
MMRSSSAIKIIVIGFSAYIALTFSVLTFVPDKPENMGWQDREAYNKVQVAKLTIGATRDEVLALMGSPDITEAKETSDTVVQIMFFRTQHVKADGLTTKEECTPVLFEDNRLVALGESALNEYEQS